MVGFLTTQRFFSTFGDEVMAMAAGAGLALEPIVLPDAADERLDEETLARIDIAYFSGDLFVMNMTRPFFAAVQGAPNVRWMHCFNAGVDNPVFTRIRQKGTRLTTSSGSSAEPIAQSVITGLLMLARRFPLYVESQRRQAWERVPDALVPPDLSSQTLTVFGLGAIGSEIARIGRALGLHVIGIRRSPQRDGDPVDEMVPPARLLNVLPRTDWLALACPLTDETRRIIGAEAIALLPKGAHILNIARGEVVDESAMIDALNSGHLAGAYLDVFEVEPLPQESPLWSIPNVIVTPHNSSISKGNDRRAADFFLRNLKAWAANQPMENEVP